MGQLTATGAAYRVDYIQAQCSIVEASTQTEVVKVPERCSDDTGCYFYLMRPSWTADVRLLPPYPGVLTPGTPTPSYFSHTTRADPKAAPPAAHPAASTSVTSTTSSIDAATPPFRALVLPHPHTYHVQANKGAVVPGMCAGLVGWNRERTNLECQYKMDQWMPSLAAGESYACYADATSLAHRSKAHSSSLHRSDVHSSTGVTISSASPPPLPPVVFFSVAPPASRLVHKALLWAMLALVLIGALMMCALVSRYSELGRGGGAGGSGLSHGGYRLQGAGYRLQGGAGGGVLDAPLAGGCRVQGGAAAEARSEAMGYHCSDDDRSDSMSDSDSEACSEDSYGRRAGYELEGAGYRAQGGYELEGAHGGHGGAHGGQGTGYRVQGGAHGGHDGAARPPDAGGRGLGARQQPRHRPRRPRPPTQNSHVTPRSPTLSGGGDHATEGAAVVGGCPTKRRASWPSLPTHLVGSSSRSPPLDWQAASSVSAEVGGSNVNSFSSPSSPRSGGLLGKISFGPSTQKGKKASVLGPAATLL